MVEFEKMAGEAVYLVEPGVEFSLVYQYSAAGSLRIITGLRGLVSKERLTTLAVIIATTLVNNGVSHFQGKAMDEIVETVAGEEAKLTNEDIKRIAEAVKNVERSKTVTNPRREFYRAVEPDTAITGIGATPDQIAKPPKVIIPRSEFKGLSGNDSDNGNLKDPEQRVHTERLELVLVQPPLIESNRQWRFVSNGNEFGAKMLDETFKKQVLEGATDLKLAGGVILDVTLETTQDNNAGVWYNKSHSIAKVHKWRQNTEQAELLLSHPSNSEDQDHQDN